MKKKQIISTVCGMAAVGMIFGTIWLVNGYAEEQKVEYVTLMSDGEETDTGSGFSYSNIADIAENAMPSIVSITNKTVQEVRSYFMGQIFTQESESCGSGIIVGENEEELLICTNNHVVEDATVLTVSFIDESSYEANVKGTDAANDLAVVAVKLSDLDQATLDCIRCAQMGDSDHMRVGEQVVAIGNALGYGQSVTTGIISAKDRSLTLRERYESTTYENLIQTDAAINPGNSGGALLNMNGELIGINSAKASSSGVEGMGYAIPITKAAPILDKLMSMQTRSIVSDEEAGYLWISGQGVTQEVRLFYGAPAGVCITGVEEGGPADAAGLQRGDIITAFDGYDVTSMEELRNRMRYYKAGEQVEITVQSSGREGYTQRVITVTLEGREAE